MIKEEVSLEDSHSQFLNQCKAYGFQDKSALVRAALDQLCETLTQQDLQESAALYAEVYDEDEETQELTDTALSEWPE